MKHRLNKKITGMVAVIMILAALLAGCGQEEASDTENIVQSTADTRSGSSTDTGSDSSADTGLELELDTETNGAAANQDTSNQTAGQIAELEVRFGDNGEPFMMQLEENETAAAIARYVGTSDWRLPIYERDDEADYNVMQYYDVSSRYDIPTNPETVTSEKAGEVYYSHPNRIVLFYHDANITGEYTRIGTFDATEDFVTAVEENPELEGWGNKIVQIAQP